jgi:hypothetical protein
MRRAIVVTLLISLGLSVTASAGAKRLLWWTTQANMGAVKTFLATAPAPATVVDLPALTYASIGNNYVTVVTGWVIPPITGDYTFYIASDDDSELSLSPDADPSKNVPICSLTGNTSSQQWDKFATQKSTPVTLQAGQLYAFKTIHRQGSGGNLYDVAWGGPVGITPVIIADPYLCGSLDKVYGPSPADGAVDVNNVTLTWSASCGVDNPIFSVYLGTDPVALTKIGDTTKIGMVLGKAPFRLAYETPYYWRVDVNGAPGDVWTFKTDDGRPHFSAVKGAAALVGKTGTMAVTVWSLDPSKITYQWYKVSEDPNQADTIVTNATGTILVRGYPVVGDPNEGQYYCVATNAMGSTKSANITFDGEKGLIHRYTFNPVDVDGVVIKDIVGGADYDGLFYDLSGKDKFQDGKLFFGNSGQGSSATTGSYVDLPNGMISSIGTQATIETWWTMTGTNGWQRVWDFGTSDAGEDFATGAGNSTNFFMSPRGASNNLTVGYRQPRAMGNAERRILASPSRPLPQNQEVFIAVVWDQVAGVAKLYYNGVLVGRNLLNMKLIDLVDNNNWIARSQYNDPYGMGAINELRFWDAALAAYEIARHAQIGPDDPSLFPPVTCATLTVGDLNGDCVVDFIDYAMMVEQWMMDVTPLL